MTEKEKEKMKIKYIGCIRIYLMPCCKSIQVVDQSNSKYPPDKCTECGEEFDFNDTE